MSTGTSTFIIRWINFLTMLLKVSDSSCSRLWAVIFLISIVGFLGAMKKSSLLLWIYLIMIFIVLVAILVFTILAFIVTNNGSGHTVNGLKTHNWKKLKNCLVKADACNDLSRRYKQYKIAKLTPIESGCCRPPSKCGYPAVNASYYDLSFHPISTNKDCKVYKNTKAVKCYDCDSCKAGVVQYMKTEWRVVAIFNSILFAVLVIIKYKQHPTDCHLREENRNYQDTSGLFKNLSQLRDDN